MTTVSKKNRYTVAKNFKICQALTEHAALYKTMPREDACKHMAIQVGFAVDPQKMTSTAKELGLDISRYEKREKRKPTEDDTKQSMFNLAMIDLVRSVINVSVTRPEHLAALQRQIEDLEEMA